MKKQKIVPFFLPFLLVLILLSMPYEFNQAMQKKGASFVAFFSWKQESLPVCTKQNELHSYLQGVEKKHAEEIESAKKVLENLLEAKVLIGHVVFRSLESYNSTFWIDVGKKDVDAHGEPFVEKYSPVLSGDCLVGVVDYVGEKASLVRLITDSSLSVSVRAMRGKMVTEHCLKELQDMKELAIENETVFSDEEERDLFIYNIEQLKKLLEKEKETHFLAKGELHGTGKALWSKGGLVLRGDGFNYDYADSHGPARDLRPSSKKKQPSLLEVGDILLTTGYDGLFPEGLKVAKVESIDPLKEGAYFYSLTASPLAHSLGDLHTLFILPPQRAVPQHLPSVKDELLEAVAE